MSYKITRRTDAVPYEVPGHYNMCPTRLHNPGDVNDGRITVGLSHFLPGGGCQFGSNMLESIYYIIEGEMELTTEHETTYFTPVILSTVVPARKRPFRITDRFPVRCWSS